jgi:chorismate-pyruvate lyase
LSTEHFGPLLQTFFALFPAADEIRGYEYIHGDDVPMPYSLLLVHNAHMTVTVEAFHHSRVDVRVMDRRTDEDSYSRKILLARKSDGAVVQFGIVRIRLDACTEEVRRQLVAEGTPVGRVLIKHGVLTNVKPTSFLRIVPGPAMMKWFGLDTPTPLYGRTAEIAWNGKRAVEVLEIVRPEAEAGIKSAES